MGNSQITAASVGDCDRKLIGRAIIVWSLKSNSPTSGVITVSKHLPAHAFSAFPLLVHMTPAIQKAILILLCLIP